MIWWDGTGLWLSAKTLEQGAFTWPKLQDGVMRLTPAQLAAMLEGLRQERSRPIIEALQTWLKAQLDHVSQKGKLAEAIRYALARWEGLNLSLEDGRVEMDSNIVERSIRPIALNRKNALFAGSDGGGDHWAVLALLIETCKLNGVDPRGYITDVITRIVQGHPNSRLDALLP